VLAWAFASLPVDRILAVADTQNAPSVSVMKRLGMVHLDDVPDGDRTSTVWFTSRPLSAGARD
jgi:RimJ/RimL family protein N-acetyltransferase